MNKLKVQPISHACQCPFYLETDGGERQCFIKQTTSVHVAMAVVDTTNGYDPKSWQDECKGEYDNCSILPLLWDLDASIAEESTETAEEPIAEPAAEVDETVKEDETAETSEPSSPDVQVSIRKVSNPYAVKTDAFIYPTNIALTVDDIVLNRMSLGKIQTECDQIGEQPKMGNCYVTSNGGKGSRVVPKAIYHAVVAGASRLVNELDIKKATRKALTMADMAGAKTVAMMPCDCGTHDINDTARVQLSTILSYITSAHPKNITHIFVVMNDEESASVYEEYFERIFE